MKFCDICENMLYMEVIDTNHLEYYCKNCNHRVAHDDKDSGSVCVSTKNLIDDSTSFKNFMSPYTKLDQTLPRVNNIKCPNIECKPGEDEVIYIKYDHMNMKYLYACVKCNHFWLAGTE